MDSLAGSQPELEAPPIDRHHRGFLRRLRGQDAGIVEKRLRVVLVDVRQDRLGNVGERSGGAAMYSAASTQPMAPKPPTW